MTPIVGMDKGKLKNIQLMIEKKFSSSVFQHLCLSPTLFVNFILSEIFFHWALNKNRYVHISIGNKFLNFSQYLRSLLFNEPSEESACLSQHSPAIQCWPPSLLACWLDCLTDLRWKLAVSLSPPAAGQLPPQSSQTARSVGLRKATGEGGIAERSNTLYQTRHSRYLFIFFLKLNKSRVNQKF